MGFRKAVFKVIKAVLLTVSIAVACTTLIVAEIIPAIIAFFIGLATDQYPKWARWNMTRKVFNFGPPF